MTGSEQTAVWMLGMILVFALGIGLALIFHTPSFADDDDEEDEVGPLASELLSILRVRGVRYEILLSDWGVDATEMRWRWVALDADRHLRTELDEDPEGDTGVTEAYMLGNAPTRAMAEAEALAWVAKQGASTVVVTS